MPEETGPEGVSLHQGPQQRILVVEDDDALAGMLAQWLRDRYGERAAVRVATSIDEGETALAELATLDLVLLDRRFPRGTGDDLLETLYTRFDPIVVMITGVDPDTELIRLPVADYLVKPLDREGLLERLSLLEKLDTAGALEPYANARKASLLESHLADPTGDALYRRFAARWAYDRLEAAATEGTVYVYELYLDADDGVDVSLVGTLSGELPELIAQGELHPVGELIPDRDGYAWIDVDRTSLVDPPEDGYVIYEFTGDVPEQFVRPTNVNGALSIERELEHAYA